MRAGLRSTKEMCWCKGHKRVEELGTPSDNQCLRLVKKARRQEKWGLAKQEESQSSLMPRGPFKHF